MVACKFCLNRQFCISEGHCILHEWVPEMDDGVEELSDVADFPDLIEEIEERENSRGVVKRYVAFEFIPVSQLLRYITLAFKSDQMLLNNIHISPGSLEHCAQHTFDTITEYGTEEMQFLKVMQCTELADEITFEDIGFLVIRDNPNCLISFGLNIAYRTKALKKEWLAKVTQLFVPMYGIPFVVTVHDKNERAIKFFEANGFKSQINADKTVSLCQSLYPPQ